MEYDERCNVTVLDKQYWTSYATGKSKPDISPKEVEDTNNKVALIITAITGTFPELKYSSESKFLSLQDKIARILRKSKVN